MNRNIKIFELDGQYCFTVDRFSSLNHHFLTKHAEQSYRYAWQAQQAAKRLALKSPYHLEVCKRYAIEDMMKPVVDEISAETRLVNHYIDIYDGLVDVADGMNEEDEKEKEINYQEAKMVVSEILKIQDNLAEDEQGTDEDKEKSEAVFEALLSKIRKLVHRYYKIELDKDVIKSKEEPPPQPAPPQGDMSMEGMGPDMGMGETGGIPPPPPAMAPMALNSIKHMKISHITHLDDDVEAEFLDEYGARACQAVQRRHPSATYNISFDNHDIVVVDKGEELLHLGVDDDLLLTSVMPLDKLASTFSFESLEFYQAYWKPVVEAIGHICVDNDDWILCTGSTSLPDIPKDAPREHTFKALNKHDKSLKPMSISFKGKSASWFVENVKVKTASTVSKYTEQDYFQNGAGAMVECIDPNLTSYTSPTKEGEVRHGQVTEVMTLDDRVELHVNFGNHIVRMTEDQVKIIDALQIHQENA